MHFDKAYVIGMEVEGAERLKRFFKSSKEAGIDVTLWPAVNGGNVNIEEYKQNEYLGKNFKLRMPGSLGCLLSHVTLWEKVHNDPDCEVALICEDDAVLRKDFLEKLSDIPWENVPDDWDMIRLGYHNVTGIPVNEYFLKPQLIRKRGINNGTFCYLVNCKNALNLKKQLIPYDNKQSMDVILRNKAGQYHPYFLANALAKETRYRYSVRQELNVNHGKSKLSKRILIKISRWFLK